MHSIQGETARSEVIKSEFSKNSDDDRQQDFLKALGHAESPRRVKLWDVGNSSETVQGKSALKCKKSAFKPAKMGSCSDSLANERAKVEFMDMYGVDRQVSTSASIFHLSLHCVSPKYVPYLQSMAMSIAETQWLRRRRVSSGKLKHQKFSRWQREKLKEWFVHCDVSDNGCIDVQHVQVS